VVQQWSERYDGRPLIPGSQHHLVGQFVFLHLQNLQMRFSRAPDVLFGRFLVQIDQRDETQVLGPVLAIEKIIQTQICPTK